MSEHAHTLRLTDRELRTIASSLLVDVTHADHEELWRKFSQSRNGILQKISAAQLECEE
jgi:hypothetical protein